MNKIINYNYLSLLLFLVFILAGFWLSTLLFIVTLFGFRFFFVYFMILLTAAIIISFFFIRIIKYSITEVINKYGLTFLLNTLLTLILSYYNIIPEPDNDTEWYFIPLIIKHGSLRVLDSANSALFYTLFPIPQIITSIHSMIAGISVYASNSSNYINAIQKIMIYDYIIVYIDFLLFLILVATTIFKLYTYTKEGGFKYYNNSQFYIIMIFILSIFSVYYLHRPFHDLVQASYGMLSYTAIIYLLFNSLGVKRVNYNLAFDNNYRERSYNLIILVLLYGFLLFAHGISFVFLTVYMLLLIVFFFIITGFKKKVNDNDNSSIIIYSYIIIFIYFMIYLIKTKLLGRIIIEPINRVYDIAMSLLKRNITSIPSENYIIVKSNTNNTINTVVGKALYEQHLHYIYTYHNITIPIAYFAPLFFDILLVFILLIFYRIRLNSLFLYNFLTPHFILSSVGLLGVLITSVISIENYIPRYLYYYSSISYVISVFASILVLIMSNSINNNWENIILITITLSILFYLFIWFSEPFFLPAFSFISTYDCRQINIVLYAKYYSINYYHNEVVKRFLDYSYKYYHLQKEIVFNYYILKKNYLNIIFFIGSLILFT